MSAFHDVILAGASGSQGYNISRSVRLRSSASAYFNRTPASSTNTKTWTWSGWFKNSTTATDNTFIDSLVDVNNETVLRTSGNQISFAVWTSGAYTVLATTPAVFRDPSAWYHIVFVLDTTQATNSNGVKVYVNGVQQTLTFSNYTQNATTLINTTNSQRIGRNFISGGDRYTDGYLTEINFIDGQALTPSSFGETDAVTGVWKPKKYAGTYGTNGFYLNFSDNSNNTAATIGKDYSGNGNNWTPNNISVTSGVTYDSMLDVPTPYADGGNGRGNYAVWNPLDKRVSGSSTFANGNLSATVGASGSTEEASATITFPSSGSWYCEITCSNVASGNARIGIGNSATAIDLRYASGYLYQQDGQKYVLGTASAYGASYTTGDVIGVAFDASSGSITFYKNNTSQGSITGISTSSIWVITATGKATVWIANFGQRPFSYTPPTGFKALNTQNLPDSTIKKGNQYFDVSLYTGTSAAQSIVNGGSMQPDFVWTKARNNASNHGLFDAVRGGSNILLSDSTGAEASGTYISSFNSNGFSVAGNSSALNLSTYTYAAWQWKESVTAGFDIVTYTGNGSARTIAHSLGVAPSMMIVKDRSAVVNWVVYHSTQGGGKFFRFNTTDAVVTDASIWNNTAPTSSVFSVGGVAGVNTNTNNYVAYLFAEVAGFSKFGSYTGNGSTDGPFVFCGFRPRYIMIKESSSTGSWVLLDTSRSPYNVSNNASLWANLSDAEGGAAAYLDILSNGFKIRDTDSDKNTSSQTYIFAAFAEFPFRNSLAR